MQQKKKKRENKIFGKFCSFKTIYRKRQCNLGEIYFHNTENNFREICEINTRYSSASKNINTKRI